MAKLGKLTKLKSAAIKRWPSLTKLSRTSSCVSAASTDDDDNKNVDTAASDDHHNLRIVYVGKSRRRYLVSSHVVDHPVFQELVDRSAAVTAEEAVVVACEVVLFEHFLWILESSETSQMGSMDDLVGFYTC